MYIHYYIYYHYCIYVYVSLLNIAVRSSHWLADGYPAGLNAPEYEEGAGQKEISERAKRLGAKL